MYFVAISITFGTFDIVFPPTSALFAFFPPFHSFGPSINSSTDSTHFPQCFSFSFVTLFGISARIIMPRKNLFYQYLYSMDNTMFGQKKYHFLSASTSINIKLMKYDRVEENHK